MPHLSSTTTESLARLFIRLDMWTGVHSSILLKYKKLTTHAFFCPCALAVENTEDSTKKRCADITRGCYGMSVVKPLLLWGN